MALKLLPRLLAFPLFAFVGQWCWMTYFTPTSIVASAIWIPVLTYCWFCVGGLSHELIHSNLPLSPQVNRWIARIIGVSVGIPASVYREVHMRHHAYLNTPLDLELWPYSDPKASLGFRRAFLWFDMLLGSLSQPVILGRVCFSSKSPASEESKKEMRAEYLGMTVFWVVAAGATVWLNVTGRHSIRFQHLIFLLPLLLAANCNSIRKMMEHLGTSSFDPLHGTRTIVGRNWLTRALSFFDFDLAVHGPHHRHPKLEHTKLHDRMDEIQEASPEVQYPVFQTFTGALIDTFRTVIRNPAVGVNAGCTDDLSHLPGMKAFDPPSDGQHIATKADPTAESTTGRRNLVA